MTGPADEEWYSEPHTLIVHSAQPPESKWDGWHLDYDIEHPASCKEEERDYGEGVTCLEWNCALAHEEEYAGLTSALRYSGTPVTEPGTYRIQAWGRKTYYYWAGYEYDSGIGVMEGS